MGAYAPGLERIRGLLAAMGHPHEAFESVHVAGTNGKGSTASLLAAIATASGRRTGLHTSPHLYRLHERLRIDGVPVPDDRLADMVTRYREAFDTLRPSFFEAMVALSFLYFAEEHVDLAVVEVGLGGRLDATNVLQPRLALITAIGLDHTHILGETLPEIAREKAGIIKPGVPVLTFDQEPAAYAAIKAVAVAKAAPLHRVAEEVTVHEAVPSMHGLTLTVRTPVRLYEGLHVGLTGRHQMENALLAIRAAELLSVEASAIAEGLRAVGRLSGLRGRLEVWSTAPLIVADVAHNAEGLAAALDFIRTARPQPGGRCYVLFGAMRDKNLPRLAALLAEAEASVFPVILDTPRAFTHDELTAHLADAGVAVAEGGTVAEGVAWFQGRAAAADTLLVAGSHQVVAQMPEHTP